MFSCCMGGGGDGGGIEWDAPHHMAVAPDTPNLRALQRLAGKVLDAVKPLQSGSAEAELAAATEAVAACNGEGYPFFFIELAVRDHCHRFNEAEIVFADGIPLDGNELTARFRAQCPFADQQHLATLDEGCPHPLRQHFLRPLLLGSVKPRDQTEAKVSPSDCASE